MAIEAEVTRVAEGKIARCRENAVADPANVRSVGVRLPSRSRRKLSQTITTALALSLATLALLLGSLSVTV